MRVNQQIRVKEIRLIGIDGKQVGLVPTEQALQMAREEGVDLVEVVAKADPPVCKLVDYGKFRYDQTKRKKESKKATHVVKIKEIKFKPNISQHDLDFKLEKAKKFLEKGHKVKLVCTFRGREMLHKDVGFELFEKVKEALSDLGTAETSSKMMGRMLSIVIAPGVGKAKS